MNQTGLSKEYIIKTVADFKKLKTDRFKEREIFRLKKHFPPDFEKKSDTTKMKYFLSLIGNADFELTELLREIKDKHGIEKFNELMKQYRAEKLEYTDDLFFKDIENIFGERHARFLKL